MQTRRELGARFRKARKRAGMSFILLKTVAGLKKKELKKCEWGQINITPEFVCSLMLEGINPGWLIAGVKPVLIEGHQMMTQKQRVKEYLRIGRKLDKTIPAMVMEESPNKSTACVVWPEGYETAISDFFNK